MTYTENITLPFKKVGDLLYHEGPLLSLFVDDDANMFLYRWVDCDDQTNHWLITSISSMDLLRFFKKEISLDQYYKECEEIVIAEIDHSIDVRKLKVLRKMPKEYAPNEKSYFDSLVYTAFADATQSLFINGIVNISSERISLYDSLDLSISHLTKKRREKPSSVQEKEVKYIKRK